MIIIKGSGFSPKGPDSDWNQQVEEALPCNEESFRLIADTLPALVWTAQPDGKIDFANQRLIDYAGLSDEVGEEGYFVPVHPDDRQSTFEIWKKSLQSGVPYEMEHRLRRYDGQYRWYLCRSTPVRDAGGRIIKWYGTSIDIQELRETQEKLAASEAKFRWLFDSNLISTIFWNIEGVVTEANHAFCGMIGCTDQEISSGQVRLQDVTPEEFVPIDLRAWSEIQEKGSCQPYEKEFRNRYDGRRVPVLVSGALLAGSRSNGIAFAIDLSERKRMEAALRSNETTLKLAIESASIGIFDYHPLDNRLIWSDLNRLHFGLPPDAPINMDVFVAGLHPDDRQQVLDCAHRALEGENNGEYVAEFRTIGLQDGKQRWLTSRGKALFDEQRQAIRFIGTTIDITDRKRIEEELHLATAELEKRVEERTAELADMITVLREEVNERISAEKSLRESESLLKTVLDTLPVAVWVLDAEARVIVGNPAAKRIWGESDKETETYKAWRHGTDHLLSCEEWGGHKAVTRGEATFGELYDIECFDGSRKTILYSAVPLKDQQGKSIGAIVVNEDITERIKGDQALQAEVAERLRAIEELRQKERLLMHQSRLAAMGEMIGNIAHQWRQPLNALGLIVQGLSLEYEMGDFNKELLDDSTNKAMQVITHMSRTIDDFRNFFLPDKEKVTFVAKEVVMKAVSLVDASFRDQQIGIVIDLEEDSKIFGYPNEYSQVLLNILMNARDAFLERKPNAPQVRIRLFRENNRAVLTVNDNAGGIASNNIDKIFDPYFTTKGPDKGTGIGLFMAKTIIEKNMNGSLSVRNTGEGAEFRIEV